MDGNSILWIVIFLAYFFPTLIAWKNAHRQSSAIFALNLFLGWCGIGWLACLTWALFQERRDASG